MPERSFAFAVRIGLVLTGVGTAKNAAAVKWQVTIRIVWAWVLTDPRGRALRRRGL